MVPPQNQNQRHRERDPQHLARMMSTQLRLLSNRIQNIENQVRSNSRKKVRKSILGTKIPIICLQTTYPGFRRTKGTVKAFKLQKSYTINVYFFAVMGVCFIIILVALKVFTIE